MKNCPDKEYLLQLCHKVKELAETKLARRTGDAVPELKQLLEQYTALTQQPNYVGCPILHHDLMFNLGCAYEHAGDLEQSIDTHQQLIKQNPDDHMAMYTAGTNLCKLGRFDEAQGLLERAVELNPHNYDYHYQNNLAYARRGGPEIVRIQANVPRC